MQLIDALRADARELSVAQCRPASLRLVSFRVLVLLRLTEAARRHRWTRPFATPLSALQLAMHGIEIGPGATIGAGVWFVHPSACVVAKEATIGERTKFQGSVTCGVVEHGGRPPVIGSDVELGAGSRILGAISVGDRARIGANAVVLADVQADETAVGIPARVVVGSASAPPR